MKETGGFCFLLQVLELLWRDSEDLLHSFGETDNSSELTAAS